MTMTGELRIAFILSIVDIIISNIDTENLTKSLVKAKYMHYHEHAL